AQDNGSSKTFSEAPGAYGSCSRGHTAQPASYETASELATWLDPEMGMASWHAPDRHYPWSDPAFLQAGACGRGNTGTSKMGWGAICNRQAASGSWTGPRLQWHINCLKLLAVLLALRRFRPLLQGKHVLVRCVPFTFRGS
ncbi:hypothetical protein M9458_010523, partial [Cirrhinus mrigala]